jgi:hypothetical protein
VSADEANGRRYLFDANVREYLSKSPVSADMLTMLRHGENPPAQESSAITHSRGELNDFSSNTATHGLAP